MLMKLTKDGMKNGLYPYRVSLKGLYGLLYLLCISVVGFKSSLALKD